MSNKIQVIQDKAGNNVFPITHEKAVRDSSGVSLEAKLSALESKTYIEAWDGASTPVVANIPAGVVVSYNGTNYTGTLAASSSTDGKIYLVKDGTEYDRYASSINLGGTYIWSYLGTTAMSLTGYATEEELGQLDQKVSGESISETINVTSGTSFSKQIFKSLAQGDKFIVNITGDNIGTQVVIYANSTATEIGRVTVNGGDVEMTAPINVTSIIVYRAGIYITASGTIYVTLKFSKGLESEVADLKTDLSNIDSEVEDLDRTVTGVNDVLSVAENSGKYYLKQSVGTTISSEESILAVADGYYKAIDLSDYAGKTLIFRLSGNAPSSSRGIMLTSNNVVYYAYNEADILSQDIVLPIPQNAVLYESHALNTTLSITITEPGLIDLKSDVRQLKATTGECFVAVTGNDANNGTQDFPFRTIAHAVAEGYRLICVIAGEYSERIRFSNIEGLKIYAYNLDSYDGEPRKRPIFSNGTLYTSFTTSGNNKRFTPSSVPTTYVSVFVDKTTAPVINYQGFENTYNAGLWAKCENAGDDFMFKPVLTAQELSEDNTFYYDGTNVYFHTSAAIVGVVVVRDYDAAEFVNCNGLELSGIDFAYGYTNGVNILGCNRVVVDNCSSHHALRRNNWDYTRSDIKFSNSKAYKARRDGFNAAWYSVAVLDNCKALYNGDDGESSHEYCEVVVVGGEYAYNGKAGHAPVNGVKFSCNGTYSHDNVVAGLYYMSASGFDYPLPLITNSAFWGNGVNDIQTDHDITLLNCVYGTLQSSEGATVTDLNL